VCSLYSFLANSALLGPSVYIGIFIEQFHVTPTQASDLVSYANLAFGFGSLLMVPLYHKIGRRPVMLGSLILVSPLSAPFSPPVADSSGFQYAAGLLGCALSNSYGTLMAFRIIHNFGSSVCEALPVQLVNDIFFLHERGTRLGFYTGKCL